MNNGKYNKQIHDVDVSPNPDADNHYYVFVEIDRNEKSLTLIREIMKDIENITSSLRWMASTHLTDKYYPLNSDEIEKYFIDCPKKYKKYEKQKKREELKQKRKEKRARLKKKRLNQKRKQNREEDQQNESYIHENFYHKAKTILDKGTCNIDLQKLNEKIIMKANSSGRKDNFKMNILDIGNVSYILEKYKINNIPIDYRSYNVRCFSEVIAPLQAGAINEYIIIDDPYGDEVMLVEQCF